VSSSSQRPVTERGAPSISTSWPTPAEKRPPPTSCDSHRALGEIQESADAYRAGIEAIE
jgi:hypothetical protein